MASFINEDFFNKIYLVPERFNFIITVNQVYFLIILKNLFFLLRNNYYHKRWLQNYQLIKFQLQLYA